MTEMMNPEEYRSQLLFGNCFDVLKRIPSNTVTAVVTDPPYGLSAQPDMREVLKHWLAGDDYEHTSSGFMGKEWDNFVPGPKIWEEVMRVLKPGGHILSFSGTRTYDLMVTAMRIAGAEVRDKIDYYCEQTSALAWVHGQGFPKSLDISKAMDKMGGQSISWFIDYCIKVAGEKGITLKQLTDLFPSKNGNPTGWLYNKASHSQSLTPEQFNKLRDFLGLPFADLKEAEREVTGVGSSGKTAIWNKEGKMGEFNVTAPASDAAKKWEGYGTALKPAHEPVAVFTKGDGKFEDPDVPFFYEGKCPTKERDYGCRNMFWKVVNEVTTQIPRDEYQKLQKENEDNKGKEGYVPHAISHGNIWPTVKPVELMRYLVKLVKMPGDNLILDPFMGSGSTILGCILEGCEYVGIDMDPVAYDISTARVHYFRCLGNKGLK